MPNTPHFSPKPPRSVEVLAFEGVQVLDVTGPLQVFASANEHLAKAGQAPAYRLRVVAKGGGAALSSAGLMLATEPLPAAGEVVDTVVVAGGPGVDAAGADPELIDWVRDRAGRARRIATVCTGAFLAAASGVLDGRRAVTHWSFCDALARRFPAVRVEPDPIFLRDGPVWTSAGVTAGIDLALALVEEDLGGEIALAVARYLVVFLKRPGGQAQFSAALSLQTARDRFAALHRWVRANLTSDLSLSVMAAQAGMSERSFSRRHLEETGVTPARAVERLRVEAARQMLTDTRQPVKRIGQLCGFGSEETMRRSFLRHLASAPQDYRCRFSKFQ
ncbi:GlxA family transcriptional regulator [Methylobacterium brachythecii]|uniref:AraC family transcriptional regulator n=1 Tax=Methylobacterium brachythecii TaxID=1176177 RepID=A0A7W6ADK6_9HYPH|nr:GlxA family transcriptional regulator [Methylobacterium brachythecii]MBB3901300.1 transcriptional regulator GlxA family with amidase domain [Methylobacterium brachythecii]GLS45677.1 AraC family transcriptional regulator [Methylobacterium brachythecii]